MGLIRDLFESKKEQANLSPAPTAICFEEFFDHKYYPFSKATKRRSHLD